MHLKLPQKEFSKNSRATGDLIGNKIANKITGVSKNSRQNNSETFTNEHDKEMPNKMPKEKYTSPEERQKIIGGLRSI